MKGTFNLLTEGGQHAFVELEVTQTGDRRCFDIMEARDGLKEKIKNLGSDNYITFFLLPSKMNNKGFTWENYSRDELTLTNNG